ncbi:hypothetical protein I8J29_08115 [Paenibacillus sp. MWE-103]|uniref:Uncharacterized protein n=1 Tax=Paenibacillus artemisiicola TaxID=1172618 RepID=A0ABS3W756_9BACL|nr:hypothetical protein [Paenibacillus artemisiicola]MBO7744154.1 hypothetical protein [Paenibacillus artemisiicola]
MKTRECSSQATFEALISRMVIARTKKEAVEKAAYELNAHNADADRITLRGERGEPFLFIVDKVELLDWHDADLTDCCHQFKVFGRMRLALRPQQTAFDPSGEGERGAFRLPVTSVGDNPVFVLPNGSEPCFLTVLQQSMSWESSRIKSIAHLSKLA